MIGEIHLHLAFRGCRAGSFHPALQVRYCRCAEFGFGPRGSLENARGQIIERRTFADLIDLPGPVLQKVEAGHSIDAWRCYLHKSSNRRAARLCLRELGY